MSKSLKATSNKTPDCLCKPAMGKTKITASHDPHWCQSDIKHSINLKQEEKSISILIILSKNVHLNMIAHAVCASYT